MNFTGMIKHLLCFFIIKNPKSSLKRVLFNPFKVSIVLHFIFEVVVIQHRYSGAMKTYYNYYKCNSQSNTYIKTLRFQ